LECGDSSPLFRRGASKALKAQAGLIFCKHRKIS